MDVGLTMKHEKVNEEENESVSLVQIVSQRVRILSLYNNAMTEVYGQLKFSKCFLVKKQTKFKIQV